MPIQNRKYVIIPLGKVEDINYDEIVQKNVQSLRLSEDGEYTLVKFDTDSTPSFLNGFTQYSHTEILAVLNDVNGIWYLDDGEKLTWRDASRIFIEEIEWSKFNPFNWFS